MPEDDAHLPDMTAVELCAYGAELAGLPPREAMERAHAALFYVGIDDKRYLPVQGYSTGPAAARQARRGHRARPRPALPRRAHQRPRPGRPREEMLALVADLKSRRGCDVVLSTHILADVERVCDHVVVLAGGKLMAVDAPARAPRRRRPRVARAGEGRRGERFGGAHRGVAEVLLRRAGRTLVVRPPVGG
jgi:ABC-2 type transport system ATP-binding protein